MKYIDPTYDTGFKLLFGRENVSEEMLMEFLNAIFSDDSYFKDIKSVKYLNNEHPHERERGKSVRYDILCETSKGHRFIVEMQKTWQKNFIARSIYYVSRAISEQGYKGHEERDSDWKYNLTPVVGVFLCDFLHSELPPKPITKVGLTDYATGEPMGNYMRYVYIQLPSFNKEENDCVTYSDQWLFNIKNMGPMQNVAFTRQNAVFQRLANVGSIASLSESDRRIYESDLKFARDHHAQISDAREESEAIGREKGRIEGRKEGRKEGLVQAAIGFLKLNQPPALVAQATGLSLREVEQLKDSLSAGEY